MQHNNTIKNKATFNECILDFRNNFINNFHSCTIKNFSKNLKPPKELALNIQMGLYI